MSEELLFVYGTLREIEVQRNVLGRTLPLSPAVLKGYELYSLTVQRVKYPALVSSLETEIQGGILTIDSSNFSALDAYEPSAYRRENVVLKHGVRAWVYVKF